VKASISAGILSRKFMEQFNQHPHGLASGIRTDNDRPGR
jgi:hypothetical protein